MSAATCVPIGLAVAHAWRTTAGTPRDTDYVVGAMVVAMMVQAIGMLKPSLAWFVTVPIVAMIVFGVVMSKYILPVTSHLFGH
tara:strand:+ start:245 stop:493 length:249 start_codon:yes stop_codon:yes gene_type:complete